MKSYSAARDSSTPSENDGPSPSPSFSRASILGSSGMRQPPLRCATLSRRAGPPRCAGPLAGPAAGAVWTGRGPGYGPSEIAKGASVANDRTFVIVGASLAGAKAAEALREEGYDGRLVLIGAEPHRPYERPPLTKGYLRGDDGADALYVHDEGFYAEHDIELLLGRTAEGLDTGQHTITLDG